MARTNTSREKILNTAATVFAGNGYWGTSMDDVAAAAQVAKGTLYYNFPTKADLFVAVIEEGIQEMRESWKRQWDNETPEEDLAFSFIQLHVDIFLDYGEIAGIFFNEHFRGLDSDAVGRIDAIRESYIAYIAEALDEGIKAQVIRQMDSPFTAYILIHMIFAACARYRLSGRENRNTLYEYLHSVIFEGIGKGD